MPEDLQAVICIGREMWKKMTFGSKYSLFGQWCSVCRCQTRLTVLNIFWLSIIKLSIFIAFQRWWPTLWAIAVTFICRVICWVTKHFGSTWSGRRYLNPCAGFPFLCGFFHNFHLLMVFGVIAFSLRGILPDFLGSLLVDVFMEILGE